MPERIQAEYKNLGERFETLKNVDFQQQFYSIYRSRFDCLKPRLVAEAAEKWGQEVPIRTTGDLVNEEESIIIGITVKHQELRPSMLKAIAKGLNELPQPGNRKYTATSDYIGLEDNLQPIRLVGNIDHAELVTGISMAVKGKETQGGLFFVTDYIFSAPMPQPTRSIPLKDKYIVFVSGLKFTGPDSPLDNSKRISYQLFTDWLIGASGTDDEQADVTSQICRVIIAGNTIEQTESDRNLTIQVRKLTAKKKHISPTVEPMKIADQFLSEITPFIPVDLMPGELDASNFMLPQQPLHRAMFPKTDRQGASENLNLVSNPYDFELDGLRVLGTAGQNIADVYRYTDHEDPLEVLEASFNWQHLSPSSPDTVGCFPFKDRDPMIVSHDSGMPCPSIYFAGNQNSVTKEQFKRISRPSSGSGNPPIESLLITIPSFSDTAKVIMVNLKNLDATTIDFASDN